MIQNRKFLGSMTDEAYRALPGLTKSELSYMSKSPKHFNERSTLFKETEAMRLGTLLHKALLEPKLFAESYAVMPVFTGFTKDGKESSLSGEAKAKKAEWIKQNEGKLIVTQGEMDSLIGMLTTAASEPLLAGLLRTGEPEVVGTWEYVHEDGTVVLCKGKVDYLIEHPRYGKTVIEVKKAIDASRPAFERKIVNYSYDLGASWYKDGFGADDFIFVAIEPEKPYPAGLYQADQSILFRGQSLYKGHLERIKQCKGADRWPGYTDGIETIGLPQWLAAKEGSEDTSA